MYYETMPLYPRMGPGCDGENCVRVPVFGRDCGGPGRMGDVSQLRRVMIENPCRPGERAEVLLGVDECGNLTVCVRREGHDECACRPCRPPRPCPPDPCPPRPCPPMPRRDGCRGRLYGSWK